MVAQSSFQRSSIAYNNSLERMATGSRINRASDDPAGLISSDQLASALAALEAESRSMDRADSVASTADGALAEMSSLLSDANAATVAMANTAGMSQAERDAYQLEIDSAMQAVDRIASTATFNGQKLFDGSMTLSVGGASLSIAGVSLGSLGESSGHSLAEVQSGGSASPSTNPEATQSSLSAAISTIATMRGQIGSFQSTSLEPMQRANGAAIANSAAAYSAIRDTDYAAESSTLSRASFMRQANMMVLGLANSSQGAALNLIAG